MVKLKDKLASNEKDLSEHVVNSKKIETKLIKGKNELERLKEFESELKKINAEIPHIKRQINDKEELLNNYNHEIKGAKEENQQKFIPEIEKLKNRKDPSGVLRQI